MKKIIKICICILFALSILVNLSGCKKVDERSIMKEKVNTELSYIDSELVSILNAVNNINYSKYKVMSQEVESTTGNTNSGGSGQQQQEQGEGQQQSRTGRFK